MINKNYFEMLENLKKICSEAEKLELKINNPFSEEWQNELFQIFREYNHIKIWGKNKFKEEFILKNIYPSVNYKDIIIETTLHRKIRIPKKWGKPEGQEIIGRLFVKFENLITLICSKTKEN